MDKSFKKNYLIVFVFFMMNFFVYAGNDEELFLRGNKYYKEADYEKAIASYNEIEKKGRAVWYNMGNCAFHMKEYAQAFIYWSRAERGAHYHERNSIARNKEHLLTVLGKPLTKTYSQKIYAYIINYAYFIPLLMLEILFLFFWYVLFIIIYKRKSKIVCVVISFCLLSVGLLLHIQYKENSIVLGVALQKTPLYAGPNADFHIIASLPSVESVVIVEHRDGWYKIQHADVNGWVKSDSIQVI